MSRKPVVIYVAGSMQQAHLLKNALLEAGIESVVTNDAIDQGAGVDILGWPTLPRVMVDRKDALLARQIAMQHDRQGAMAAQEPAEATPAEPSLSERWPCCPTCGRPRTTRCKICHTTGSNFPEADSQYVWGVGLDEAPEPSACGSCSCEEGNVAGENNHTEGKRTPDEEDDPPPLVLRCTTCDEPFLPEFARRCGGCGHEFPDGYESEDEPAEPSESLDSRVVAVLVGLGLLAAGLAAWFLLAAGNS